MKAVEEEGEVGGGFWGDAVVLEPHVFAGLIRRLPSIAMVLIDDHGIES